MELEVQMLILVDRIVKRARSTTLLCVIFAGYTGVDQV
jgi:hypothetical protein